MKILLSVASLKPSYGGPAFSVSQLANALCVRGAEVGLWAPDGSAATSDLVSGAVIRLAGSVDEALARFGRPDVIHDNGIWLAHNHRLAVLSRRAQISRVVSTRGMLEPWAMQHKGWKKKFAWALYQRRDLLTAAALHATAQSEADNIAALKLHCPVEVIANGVPVAHQPPAQRRNGDSVRTALFLGRIYPVKGLPLLIEAWSQIRPEGWRLCIAGPDEAGHQAVVEAAVEAHKLSDVVDFRGAVAASQKAALFSEADLFVLPSHSESFGMAVGEALAHGLPVLTTKAAPWPQLGSHKCGWWVDPTVSGLSEGLRAATGQTPAVLAQMGQRGKALVTEEFSWEAAGRRLLDLYSRLGPAPVRPRPSPRSPRTGRA